MIIKEKTPIILSILEKNKYTVEIDNKIRVFNNINSLEKYSKKIRTKRKVLANNQIGKIIKYPPMYMVKHLFNINDNKLLEKKYKRICKLIDKMNMEGY